MHTKRPYLIHAQALLVELSALFFVMCELYRPCDWPMEKHGPKEGLYPKFHKIEYNSAT